MRTRGQALNAPPRGAAQRGRVAATASVPAPVGGLNARDALANMKPTDAVILDNWVPGTASVDLRLGQVSQSTGYASKVETLATYRSVMAEQMFAISGGSIYDASAPGAHGAAVSTGYTSSRFKSANFGTTGGQFLYLVNGADHAVLYDGTTWRSITGVSTPFAITGVDTSTFKDVQVYGRRLWFTEKSSFRIWYLPLESIAGAAQSIDLAPLFLLGGSLQGMVVWTVASELATTQYAIFVSSEGECVMYGGYDPADVDNFGLVGTFRIGKPIGQNFWERVGTDTLLITEDGLIPISKAAINNRQSQSDAVSYKIQNLVSDDIQTWGSAFGWQVVLFPAGNKIILNAPRSNSSETVQYVMNTLVNQWCRYKGLPAYCWVLFEDKIFYGSDTTVQQAETTNSDNGNAIMADILPAYSYFGGRGEQKFFTTARPIITSNGAFKPSIGISTDFTTSNPTSTPTLSLGINGSPWNTSPWNTSPWGGTFSTSTTWAYVGAIGFAAALRMQSLTKEMAVSLQSIDYAYETGTGIY